VTTDFLPTSTPRRADGATLVCVFVVALMLVPARAVVSGVPFSLTPADLVALLIAMSWFCAQFTTTLGVAKGRNPARTGLFVYVTVMLIAFGYATYGYLPKDEVNLADHAAVLVIALVGMALGVCDGIRAEERLDLVLKTVVVAGAVVAIVGILQFVADFDLTKYMVLPGMHYTEQVTFVTERSDLRRVGGTTGHPIEFGVLCAMVLPIAVHYGFRAKDKSEPSWLWWACAAIIGAGLMFSVSRSAVLALACVAIVLFIGWPVRRRVTALIVTAFFLVVMKFTVPGLLGTFYSLFANAGQDDSIRYRTHDYDTAAAEIANNFWLGRGLGTWYAPKHQVFDNQYLLSFVETGLIGTLAFAAVFVVGIGVAVRMRYLSADPTRRDLGLTLAASLMVPLAGSATFDMLSFHMVTGLSFLLVGAAGAVLRFSKAGMSRDHNGGVYGSPLVSQARQG
jgi:O-antigen ligase